MPPPAPARCRRRGSGSLGGPWPDCIRAAGRGGPARSGQDSERQPSADTRPKGRPKWDTATCQFWARAHPRIATRETAPSSGSTSWLDRNSGIAIWGGTWSRSPVSASASLPDSRTATRCPGVWPWAVDHPQAAADIVVVRPELQQAEALEPGHRGPNAGSTAPIRCLEIRPVGWVDHVAGIREARTSVHDGPARVVRMEVRQDDGPTSAGSTPAAVKL